MKISLVTVVLALAIAAPGQIAAPTPARPNDSTAKVIQNPAEYKTYMNALNTQDAAAKAAAMEAFVQQYPQSIVLTDALEQAMSAYQQAGNQAKVLELAKRLLQIVPGHIRALAVITAIDRAKGTSGDASALKEACADAQTGLQTLPGWQKPEDISDADFKTLHTQLADIFNGAAGFCALQNKDYAGARTFYEKAFQIDPTNLQDLYQLSVADLEMKPMDVNGLWYCSKTVNLAQRQNPQAVSGITAYCKSRYKRYHGGEDGWDQLIAETTNQNSLPAQFATHIKRAPTPQELAVQAVQENSPDSLSFGDDEFVLQFRDASPANKDAADKVWATIQSKEKNGTVKLKLPQIKVISSTKDTVDAAITDDNQAANKADLHIILEAPLQKPLTAGTMIDIIGVITNYTPQPFMFIMEKGKVSP